MRKMSVLTLLRKCLFSNQGFNYLRTFASESTTVHRIIHNHNVSVAHVCWCNSRNQSQKLHNFSRRYLPLDVDRRFTIYDSPGHSINHFHTGSRLHVSRVSRRNNKQTDSSAKGEEVHNVKEGEVLGAKENGVKDSTANGETLVQKFKRVYKEHGYVLVAVHFVTSAVWFGSFFAIIQGGVDIVAVLEQLGFSEKILKPFKNSSAGSAALAYLMYKLATPARYTVTLTGTAVAVRLLRRLGWMKQDKITHVTRQARDYGRQKLRKQRIKTKKALSNTRGVISLKKMRDKAKNVTRQARDYGQQQLKKQRMRTKHALSESKGVLSFKKMRERAKNKSQDIKEKVKREGDNKSNVP